MHSDNPAEVAYARFSQAQLILRDELAIDRTVMANERTLLAYLRSAMALLITGATIAHFSETAWFLALGIFCIPLGITAAVFGFSRFNRNRCAINSIRNRMPTISANTDSNQ